MTADIHRSTSLERRSFIRSPQEFAAGAFLTAFSLFALWAGSDLSTGQLNAIGPGLLPRWIAYLVGLSGVALLVLSFLKDGASLERWGIRGPIFVLSSIMAFALTIRLFGLAVAGPLSLMIGGLAAEDTKLKELIVFGIIMTAFCIGLFRYALNLPIPVLIIPGYVTM